jgi:hypothetical protein
MLTIMVRTQIQLPDDLFARAKRVAEDREISMTELIRRGLEAILTQYPPLPRKAEWQLPIADVGRVLVPLDQLQNYSADDE